MSSASVELSAIAGSLIHSPSTIIPTQIVRLFPPGLDLASQTGVLVSRQLEDGLVSERGVSVSEQGVSASQQEVSNSLRGQFPVNGTGTHPPLLPPSGVPPLRLPPSDSLPSPPSPSSSVPTTSPPLSFISSSAASLTLTLSSSDPTVAFSSFNSLKQSNPHQLQTPSAPSHHATVIGVTLGVVFFVIGIVAAFYFVIRRHHKISRRKRLLKFEGEDGPGLSRMAQWGGDGGRQRIEPYDMGPVNAHSLPTLALFQKQDVLTHPGTGTETTTATIESPETGLPHTQPLAFPFSDLHQAPEQDEPLKDIAETQNEPSPEIMFGALGINGEDSDIGPHHGPAIDLIVDRVMERLIDRERAVTAGAQHPPSSCAFLTDDGERTDSTLLRRVESGSTSVPSEALPVYEA
ncbi:hypothetical protein K439DRAFT_1623641 [Ramaria rubella]|nr:hypothetical protein K439DRAFT_1623641 [Ramaria rubella]